MLLLSGMAGQKVHAGEGTELGRLKDLTVRIGPVHPRVHRLVTGGHGKDRHLVPWSAVAALEPAGTRLTDLSSATSFVDDSDLEPDELLLRRDVLDTQIFDSVRHRLTRVSDVLLALTEDGSLEVVAVEVSMGAVVRRLGMKSLANHLRGEAVDWRDLHLTSDRGHDIQLVTTTAAVHRLDTRGLADLLTQLNPDKAHTIIQTVDRERAAGAVALTHPDVRVRLLPAMAGGDAQLMIHGAQHRARRFLRLAGWRRNLPSPGETRHDVGFDDSNH